MFKSLNDKNFFAENIERKETVNNQLRLNHLNEEDLIIELCLEFPDIFYHEGDKLTYKNEIKHCIDTQNAKPIFTKSYRYSQIHKQEVQKIRSRNN